MRNTPVPPGNPGRSRPLVFMGLALVTVLLALAVTWWLRGDGVEPPAPARVTESRPSSTVARPPTPPAPPAPAPAPRVPVPTSPSSDALSAALNEERVSLTSSVVVEGIDMDRSWVCAGEAMSLSARLAGEPEPGAVYRWVWPVSGGGAELHPGPTLQWKAPTVAGRYRVRFQVCKDLGGRRVGVLAEREVELDVRSCGEGSRQQDEPLRLAVTQRGQGTFAFQALFQGPGRVTGYAWDFGDGTSSMTTEPSVEHTYALQELAAQETRSFTVRLQARLDRGGPLEATTFVLARGQPPAEVPPPVELRISRWRPDPDSGGWRSEVVVRAPEKTDITWERLERLLVHWDGEADFSTRDWREVIQVEELLEHGGFRGYVKVSPTEAGSDIKQILDSLYGHDAAGKEVVVSWSPFKREAPAQSPVLPDPPPAK